VGDTADSIAGVPSIGPKRAQTLLGAYPSLDSMLDAAKAAEPASSRKAGNRSKAGTESFPVSEKLRMVLLEHEKAIATSLSLTQIHTRIPLASIADLSGGGGTSSEPSLGSIEQLELGVGGEGVLSGRSREVAREYMDAVIEEYGMASLNNLADDALDKYYES
jgi:5'-3' exonuclease